MIKVGAVEDEPLVVKFHKIYLEKMAGFSWAGSAATLHEGMKLVKESHMDVLLLDVYLQGENGLDLLRYIREQDLAIDVVLITSANDRESVQVGHRFGAVDYLIKPFTYERFQEAMLMFKNRQPSEHSAYCQEDIDRLFHARNPRSVEVPPFPKGITKETAIRVLDAFENQKEWLTAAVLSEITSISHVSLRKYLRFFVENSWIDKDVIYQPSGRPLQQYRLTAQGMKTKESGFV
ncbi:response regulator of citrate/malate metabolism [Geomicrobium halophilum]|uniref:Transcriptional regulatory protein n=1 Tax=Geomicrobium halophilum TaxID=549000 RepID=A0A841PVR5_9BACL|nr:response regulator [Geomicrobium halophilum]MBB6451306.1 response regulator of citrate/malate metabolism [Geomicrobium halophilum]